MAHLAALLSEAETQNGRLEKLVEVLKEEIRTYQRSEERHKHIENLEYVKNVILKFITLTGPGEKAALVPVLKTILRLKQEEVAQVEELVRKEGEIGTGEPESWGGYLGLWLGFSMLDMYSSFELIFAHFTKLQKSMIL